GEEIKNGHISVTSSVSGFITSLYGLFSKIVLGQIGDGINGVNGARIENSGCDHKTWQERM
ncbi:hypothetical protein, partial [Staphylococcus aureus]